MSHKIPQHTKKKMFVPKCHTDGRFKKIKKFKGKKYNNFNSCNNKEMVNKEKEMVDQKKISFNKRQASLNNNDLRLEKPKTKRNRTHIQTNERTNKQTSKQFVCLFFVCSCLLWLCCLLLFVYYRHIAHGAEHGPKRGTKRKYE